MSGSADFPYARSAARRSPSTVRIEHLEVLFIVAVLALIINPAILDILTGSLPMTGSRRDLGLQQQFLLGDRENSPVSLVAWPLIYAVSGLLLLWRGVRVETLLSAGLALGFCVFLTASALWSEVPATSVMRGVHTLGKAVFAVYLVQRFPLPRVWALLAISAGVVVAAGWLVGIAFPGVAWQGYRGEIALRGLFTHKSGFGATAMVLLVLTGAFYLRRISPSYFPRRLQLGLLVLGAVTLLASRSATALLLSITAMGILVGGAWISRGASPRERRTRLILLGVTAIVLSAAAYASYGFILELVGRDATLSRRTEIWGAIIRSGELKPWLGHGYFGFWRFTPGSGIYEIIMRENFVAASPHNSYLLAWLDTGWVGLALFLALVGQATLRAMRLMIDAAGALAPLPLAMLAPVLLTGLVESNLFKGQQAGWIVLVIVTVGSGLALRRGRRGETAGRVR